MCGFTYQPVCVYTLDEFTSASPFICMRIQIRAHTCTHEHAHTYMYICIPPHTHRQTFLHTPEHVHTCTNMHTHMHTYRHKVIQLQHTSHHMPCIISAYAYSSSCNIQPACQRTAHGHVHPCLYACMLFQTKRAPHAAAHFTDTRCCVATHARMYACMQLPCPHLYK
jgi:hypothetical protein